MDYAEAIRLAKAGEERGFTLLYEKTYKSKYYFTLQYMKNEEAAQDVLQEAYLKAFSKIETLDNPEAFPKWLGIIIANTAKNALVKKNPMLFTDIAVDDEEYQIEDDSIEYQPETAYTRQETQQLVHELMDKLSEEQRVCILMFHIEGISIKEIASVLDCSENTVKSRLKYGRDNLKMQAEELQKKGYKLYSVAPIPLLLYLLRMEFSYLSVGSSFSAAGNHIAKQLFHSTAAPIDTGASDGMQKSVESGIKATKSGFIHTVAGKITVVVVGLCIVGGAVFYGVTQMNSNDLTSETAVIEEQEDTVTEEPPLPQEEIEEDAWKAAYKEIIQDAPNQTYEAGDLLVVQPEIYYILHDMDGNDIPELIIQAMTGYDDGSKSGVLSFRNSILHIYSYDKDAGARFKGQYEFFMPSFYKDEQNNLIISSGYPLRDDLEYYVVGMEKGEVYEKEVFNQEDDFVLLETSKVDDLTLLLGEDEAVISEAEAEQPAFVGTYKNSEGISVEVRTTDDGQIMVIDGYGEHVMDMNNIQEDGGILGYVDKLPNGDTWMRIYIYPVGIELSAYDHSAGIEKATDQNQIRLFFTGQDVPDIRSNVYYLIE